MAENPKDGGPPRRNVSGGERVMRKRVAELEAVLRDTNEFLSGMYIPEPSNHVVVDGVRVFFKDRRSEKKNLLSRINLLTPELIEVT